jgi:hypothetical protein
VNLVQDLNIIKAFVKANAPSTERTEALSNVEEIRGFILGKGDKHDIQKQLMATVAKLEAYVMSLKSSPHKPEGYEDASKKVQTIYQLFNLPAKDCKSPVVSLSVQ